MVGLATHHLPGKVKSPENFKFLLPPDWKSWARVGLGIASVNQLNKGIGWKPPAWATGLLSAGVITPLALRFSKTTELTFLLIAPLVATSVQTSQWMNQAFSKDARQKWGVPEPVSRLMISLTIGGLGAVSAMAAHKAAPGWNLFGKKIFAPLANKKEALGAFATQTCARGCTPSIICLSEIGETLGGMTHWFKSRGQSDQNPNERR